MSKIKLTPAMRQYSEFKEQHPDSILFFRMGDFYEMFFDDAIIASNILGIALTSRDKEKQIPMCGIPYHAAKTYIPRLIKEGHKVSICDQVGEVGAGKIVDRAVTQVITPGTAMDDYGSYEGKSNSYIASVFRGNSVYGFSYMDLTTGEYKYTEVVSTQSVLDELSRLTVREVIIEEELYRSNFEAASLKIRFKMPYLSFVPREFFNEDPATNDHGGHSDDEVQTKLDLGSSTGTIAAKALINYVRTSCNIPLNNISSNLVKYNAEDYLYFDDKADSNLNIQSSADQSSTGTLLTLLDKTKSSLGGRRLRSWVARPLLDVAVITERHDAVEELYNDRVLLKKIQGMLGDVYDIERIMTRVELLRAAPVDLIQLARTLNIISKFKEELSRCSSERFQFISVNLVDLTELFKVLSEAIVDEFSEDD
ncbi:MAG: hypothetical protein KAR06_04545, partial [Deltaproteobacteria bacterium]|nr:hypothetical protein [Deltaproteobacteria bacterium]